MEEQTFAMPQYSTNLWDYLSDMPNMPSNEDREILKRKAEGTTSNPLAMRSLKLWDYFFRIKPENVGKPQRDEIAKLEKGLNQLQKIMRELVKQRKQVEDGVREKLARSRRYRKNWGIALIIISSIVGLIFLLAALDSVRPVDRGGYLAFSFLSGVVFLLGASLFFSNRRPIPQHQIQNETETVFYPQQIVLEKQAREIVRNSTASSKSDPDLLPTQVEVQRDTITQQVKKEQQEAKNTANGCAGAAVIAGLVIWYFYSNFWGGIIAAGILAFIAFASQGEKLSDKYLEVQVENRFRAYVEAKRKNASNSEQKTLSIETYIQRFSQRIELLKSQIQLLINQIPPNPTDYEVATWFSEAIARLEETAIEETAMTGKFQELAGRKEEKPFCIPGPGELQELIPPPYNDESKDQNRHLQARRFTIIDEKFVDFYGVYYIEFIIIGKEQLATYGTFYDFITNSQFQVRTRVQNYIDVVTVQTQRGFKQIKHKLGNVYGSVVVNNVPSLSLSFTSGEVVHVTYPNNEYFEATDAKDFNSYVWKNNPKGDADAANAAIRRNVENVKRRFRNE